MRLRRRNVPAAAFTENGFISPAAGDDLILLTFRASPFEIKDCFDNRCYEKRFHKFSCSFAGEENFAMASVNFPEDPST